MAEEIIYEDEEKEFSNFVDIQFIPIIQNEMPILLCEFVMPETDMNWSEVLVFEKGRYVATERQRVKINEN